MKPSRNPAERGALIKVLMPLVDNKLPVRFGKLLRPGELTHFQAQRFTKLDAVFNIEHSPAAATTNVNKDRPMFVAVKEEPISVLFENLRHRTIVFEFAKRVRPFSSRQHVTT